MNESSFIFFLKRFQYFDCTATIARRSSSFSLNNRQKCLYVQSSSACRVYRAISAFYYNGGDMDYETR